MIFCWHRTDLRLEDNHNIYVEVALVAEFSSDRFEAVGRSIEARFLFAEFFPYHTSIPPACKSSVSLCQGPTLPTNRQGTNRPEFFGSPSTDLQE